MISLDSIPIRVIQINSHIRVFLNGAIVDHVTRALAIIAVEIDASVCVAVDRAVRNRISIALARKSAGEIDAVGFVSLDRAVQNCIPIALATIAGERDADVSVAVDRAVRNCIAIALATIAGKIDAVASVAVDRAVRNRIAIALATTTAEIDAVGSVSLDCAVRNRIAIALATTAVEIDAAVRVGTQNEMFKPVSLTVFCIDTLAKVVHGAVLYHNIFKGTIGCTVQKYPLVGTAPIPAQRKAHQIERHPTGRNNDTIAGAG